MNGNELFDEEINVDTTLQEQELVVEKDAEKVEQEAKKEAEKEVSKEADSNKQNGPVMIVMTFLIIIAIGLCVYIAASVSKMMPAEEKKDIEYQAQTADPWEEILGEEYKENTQDAQDKISGPYYEELTNSIDTGVSYKVAHEMYECVEAENDVDIRASYVQLEGDIPNLTQINERLKQEAIYFPQNYEKNKNEILESLHEWNIGVNAEIESFVTYNTQTQMSVVIREQIDIGYVRSTIKLYSYNIDLTTGTILNNADILNLGFEFGEEFRQRSNKQNGVSEEAIDQYSNDEIAAKLKDENSLILFYTPLGLELGYNYEGENYTGWITITMQDYKKYLAQ